MTAPNLTERGDAVTRLHPDWPEFDPTDRWELPGPVDDLDHALGEAFVTTAAPIPAPAGRFALADVSEVVRYEISYHGLRWTPGSEDGSELELLAVLRLTDGRWASVAAGNDYTGWGCQGDYADVKVADSEDDLVRFGLTQEQRRALGYEAQP